jgi:hypothetical protein
MRQKIVSYLAASEIIMKLYRPQNLSLRSRTCRPYNLQ